MEKHWHILPAQENESQQLKEQLNINGNICSILYQRGICTFEEAKKFFRPSLDGLHSPWLMKDMDKAVSRIENAIAQNEHILIFGDYDVDGTTSVATFFQFLQEIYPSQKNEFYIPHRYREGYGVSKAGIDYAASKGISLIICIDCGIKSIDLIQYAKSLNIDFIVCDHHLPGNILPEAVAILNPKQLDCAYPYKELCGCGVAFKLMEALAIYFNLDKEKYFRYLDLVATAIAADIVPITGENRILAFYGMKRMNENPSVGMSALMQLGTIHKPYHITNVVFVIAPRVNAAGRMDDAKKAVQLFIEKDPDKAIKLAASLQTDNSDRKETDSSITQEALEIIRTDPALINNKSCVLYREHWHKGVVGIVASRLIEQYYRPTVVLTKSGDLVTGSARSVKGFNLYEAIYACRDSLVAYGGHFAAAGLSMLPEKVNEFTQKFNEVVHHSIPDHLLIPELLIDATISFAEITPSFYNIICQMEPFGPENMRPVFIAKKVLDTGHTKIVKEQHIKFVLQQDGITLSGIGFNMQDKFALLQTKKPIDIVFTIDENNFQGNKSLQLKVIDFRLSE